MTKTHKIPTRAEGIERLRTLYAVLAGIPADKNRLHTYVNEGKSDIALDEELTPKHLAHSCGASACALGWAALYPEFNELGLNMDPYTDLPRFENDKFDDFDGACYLFFCLTEPESLILFGPKDPIVRADYGPVAEPAMALKKILYEGLPKRVLEATDKRVALHRIRKFLELTDAITPERSAELAEIEKGY